MNRVPYAARAVFLGLLTTQMVATVQVYLSNTELLDRVMVVTEAGYLAIPNQRVAPDLAEFPSAVYGGLFFTLSIGAGLSLLSLASAWIWDRIFGRHCGLMVPLVLVWLGMVAAVNSKGFSLFVALYFLVVPVVVFACALKWMPEEAEQRVWLRRLAPILPIILLTIIWTAHADKGLFLDIRDYLLLSNPVGKKVERFYYRYTLYPAEVFKSLEQKSLKTCRLVSIQDRTVARNMEEILIRHDYLPVGRDTPVDLEIVESEGILVFRHQGETVLQSTYKEFFSKQKEVLTYFSAETDRHELFRQATFLGLLIGFPLTLYLMVYASIHYICRFFVSLTPSSLTAGILSFVIGLALLAPLHMARSKAVHAKGLSEALDSESWLQRVTALRSMVRKNLEIAHYGSYHRMLVSPHIPERYWLAKALGCSHDPRTYQDLLALLDDPHPNVVSQAFHALGERGEERAIQEILKRIRRSDHWYNQWHAYEALRRLGWTQSRQESRTEPLTEGNEAGLQG